MAFLQKYWRGSTDGAADTRPPGVPTASSQSEGGHAQLRSGSAYIGSNPFDGFTTRQDEHGMQEQEFRMATQQLDNSKVAYPIANPDNQPFEFENQARFVGNFEGGRVIGYPSGEVRVPQQELVGPEEQHVPEIGNQSGVSVKKELDVEDTSSFHGHEDDVQANKMAREDDEAVLLQQEENVQEMGTQAPDLVKKELEVEDAKFPRGDGPESQQSNREQQHYDEGMADQALDNAHQTSEVDTPGKIKNEPDFHEQHSQQLRYQPGVQQQQFEGPKAVDIMDFYGIDTMNDEGIQDQWASQQAPASTVESFRRDAPAYENDISQKRTLQQNTTSQMSQYLSHAIPERKMQDRRRTEQAPKPSMVSFQPNVVDEHNVDRQQIPKQTAARGSNHYPANASGDDGIQDQLRANQSPIPFMTSSRSNVSNERNVSVPRAPRPVARKEMTTYPSHTVGIHGSPEQPRKKQAIFRPAELQRPSTSNGHDVNRRDFMKRAPKDLDETYGPNKASSSRKNVTAPDTTGPYNGPGRSSNHYFSPLLGPENASAYGYYDMTMYGQPHMPTMPPHGPPQGQEQSGMYEQNAMHPYHSEYFYDQSQLPMENPYQQPFLSHPQHGYHMPVPAPSHPPANPYMSPQALGKRKAQDEDAQEHSEEDEGEGSSDDDEPLLTRTQRYRSSTNHSDATHPELGRASDLNTHEGSSVERGDQDIHFISSKPRQKLTINMPASKAPRSKPQATLKKVAPLSRPLPQPMPQTPQQSNDNPDSSEISWKLPPYAIEPQPADPVNDQFSVKVTLPNMIRETILLSPDHATQETHLLRHLFLPGQQALAVPDPEPTIATLNFHTVAVIVLDAYASFQAGDELTSVGRENRKNAALPSHETDEEDSENEAEAKANNDVRDVDIDEIFFAVIDRWRAGKASDKKPYSLIRGVQEFCDISLDIIYYIHEHGLLPQHNPDRTRKERKDKGVKRGPRGLKAEEKEAVKKQSGRPKAQESAVNGKGKGRVKAAVASKRKVNTLQPKKKAKTKKDGKERWGSVTVTRK